MGTLSAGTNSSKASCFSPKRLFKKSPTKNSHRGEKTPDEAARTEATSLMASGAWMCAVCGTLFDTSKKAAYHETICLMEWLQHDKLVRSAWRDEQKPKNTSGVPILFHQSEQRLNYPEYLPPRTGGEIPVSPLVQKYLLMTDEALVSIARSQRGVMHQIIDSNLCALSLKKQKAREDASPAASDEYTDHDKRNHEDLFLCEREYDAMHELELASRDRHYYADLEQRAMEKRAGPQPHFTHQDYYYHRLNRIRSAGTDKFHMDKMDPKKKESGERKSKISIVKKTVKGRLDHAYKLSKGATHHGSRDNERKAHKDDRDNGGNDMWSERSSTLYINVVVKNSIQVVNNELERMARGWWQTEHDKGVDQDDKVDFQFEWIRAQTQKRVIQLAGIALASDFTPGKVAVQLSTDLYRLMEPQLKPCGVTIQTVIEYRDGRYFVLAVNIIDVDWLLLMKWVAERNCAVTLRRSPKDLYPGDK